MPETKRHLKLRTLLFVLLERAFADRASIGSDQFVYYRASDPKRCLAPDAFVRLGAPDTAFGSWKTWERGAPELCVEIVSDSDAPEGSWSEKLAAYHELGVEELVRFDPDAKQGERLRVWDRLHGDLVERVVDGDRTACFTLDLIWIVCPAEGFDAALRLATQDGECLPTPAEGEAREARAREAEARAREAAERRVAELEAELARRRG